MNFNCSFLPKKNAISTLNQLWKWGKKAMWWCVKILEAAAITWIKRGQGRTKRSEFDTVVIKVAQLVKRTVFFRARFIYLEACKIFPIIQLDNYFHMFTVSYGKVSCKPSGNCHNGQLPLMLGFHLTTVDLSCT